MTIPPLPLPLSRSHRRPAGSAPATVGSRRPRWAVVSLALLVAVTGLAAFAAPATAAPVYKIEGEWENAPATISRGNPVVAEWRINVNDNAPAPSNDPVDNVTATFTVDKAFFDGIPDLCKRTGVTPASSLDADRTTLTCNFGTVDMGTALLLQTPVVANGNTGEEIVLDGTGPDGENVELPPILIRNPFVMDMQFAGTSNYNGAWDDVRNPSYVDVPFNWSLRLGNGSDPGPNTVSYRLSLVDVNGNPVVLGTHPTGVGLAKNYGVQGCTEHDLGNAEGHPYSTVPSNPRHTNFVDSCTLAPVAGQPGVFTLTLTGVNYDLVNAPTHDSFGNPLPANWDYVAAGQMWVRVLTDQAGSVRLTSNAPTYTAPTGQTTTDLAGNNAASKTYVLPGGFSAAYLRHYTNNGGDRWDDTYRVSTGTTVWTYVANHLSADSVPATARYGVCQVLDTQYVDFNPTAERPIEYWVSLENQAGRQLDGPPTGAVVEYYTGGVGDPNTFNCGNGTWSTTQPANPATVTAVRMTYPHSSYAAEDAIGIQFRVPTRIQDNASIGQDIWTFGSYLRNGTWVTPADVPPGITPTPGERYPYTNARRDVLWVVLATPAIRKASAQNTVTPGVPAQFTLTYSANGTGTIPPTVDDYVIRDTLPVGMTYVAGSASPEPVISMNGQRQVLTWTLDDVATNTQHPLVYEAVADDTIAPGTQLTNTAVSSLAGEESAPASKTVTTTANGYTVISKTADTPYIPNLDGSGDGEGVWSVTLRSFDPLPQAFTDTIDILPFEGDARGTDFEGDYSLVGVEPVAGSQVFYTTADPATLSDDPADPMNGAPNNPVGNTVGWTPVFTPDATAVRVIGPRLDPGATQQFKVRIATDGADPRDLYVNRAQARTGHTRLEMRTSEPMSVAYYYSAALKKYVQDNRGNWRDAQDLADYPAFRYGDTVRYRIVVENTGQGTITNLDVSDDQQPALGNFHIDELAPGETESHEFEFVLDESTDGTVVNTACADADIPADSQVPPTINCDPAGFEVANYTTVKSANPDSGSPVKSGQRIRYTVLVTQQGSAPAEAEFTDDLTKVLDDASYNKDIRASIGTVRYRRGQIAWNGTIPVGEVARITYSVTVRDVARLGNRRLVNPVTSPGCEVRDGRTVNCRTDHRAPRFDLVLDKRVIGSSQVLVGGTVKYRLRVTNRGPDVAPAPLKVVDRLPRGLQLQSARGRGWDCTVHKRTDRVSCSLDRDLGAKRNAPPVYVIAKTTRAALARRVVNTARVACTGEARCTNNPDVAGIRVRRVPPLPSTGFRVKPGWWR
ncbi:DUF7507 domain-containing protein [Nocardioides sp. SYSU DS0651]|uniref:DUF7927 domain-containing protein n=1 Tax=Nocardioides sp. SYSU DS0651 TaxID=3415955 RepID=UPI003F4C3D00